MIGTRVEVAGPRYLEIAVKASVKAFQGQDQTRLRDAIVAALNAFFDPFKGGPEGTGWPFGRDVYETEVLQVIAGVPGVDHVTSVSIKPGNCDAQCGNVCLSPSWLVLPGAHQIEVL
jgi:hypothetical protein